MAKTPLACTCGSFFRKPIWTVSGIDIVECTCGVRRVDTIDKDVYTAMYADGKYHTEGSPDLPHDNTSQDEHRKAHRERFTADIEVAKKRLNKLSKYYKSGGTLLIDVGCANGAFMNVVSSGLQAFHNVYGVDLSKNAVSPLLTDKVRVGDLKSVGFQRRTADVITFNDSFEHFMDPITALKAAKGILKRDGLLVIEIPDMGCADAISQGQNFKHVKPHEHLFYFTANQLRALLETNGFNVIGMDVPIPGKVTAYACPEILVEDIEVHGPPGVGDTLWTLHKLRGIREKEWPCRLKYIVDCYGETKATGRARDFLLLSPDIDSFDIQQVPLPRDVGCEDPSVPVYYLFPNDYLEPKVPPFVGGLIENWHPELSTNWDTLFVIPEPALNQVHLRMGTSVYAAVYMSSKVWNHVVTEPVWTPKHWAEYLIRIADANIRPVIVGGDSDAAYANDVAEEIFNFGRNPGKVWINTIGRTSLPLVMAYMHCAAITVGIANGLPMLPLYTGGKAIILWPVRKLSPESLRTHWTEEFQYGWLPPHIRNSGRYKYLAIGQFTAVDLFGETISLVHSTGKCLQDPARI